MYLESPKEKLFYRQWPVTSPKAVVVISHGLGEHSGRYEHVADFLNQRGMIVYAIDHRGHGKSAGIRGHVENFSQYTEDLGLLISELQMQHEGLPFHLLGHSMGGLIATGYALRYETVIASLVLSSPAYGVIGLANKISLRLAPLLVLLAPTMSLSNGLDAKAVSRDPSVVESYQADPLVHDRVTPTWARAFYAEQRFVAREIARLAVPTLMLVAGADSLADPDKALALFERITGEDKDLQVYPQSFHEIFNEPEQDEALEMTQGWFETAQSC